MTNELNNGFYLAANLEIQNKGFTFWDICPHFVPCLPLLQE